MKRIFKSKKGQGMTEYILIIALIAILVIAGVKIFGKKVKSSFKKSADVIEKSVDEGISESQR